jgi:hypothetical protein
MAQPRAFHWTLEAQRMRSALDMHDLGVELYRQRMRREHPDASRGEIESLVRTWLTAPSPDTRLRLPSRVSLASVMGPGCCHEEGTTLGHE